MKPLIIATRKSPLALWQANWVADKLRQLGPQRKVELLPLTTSGDQASGKFLENGKGLFVKELEEALLNGRATIAVHSMKDVPATFPVGFGIAAICARGNPFDALVSPQYTSIETLPQHAKVGTASLRRQAQLLKFRPDLKIETIRGNVQTRLNKLHTEAFDAIILAAAGLERLDLDTHIRTQLTPPLMIPACGQGAIGVECNLTDQTLMAELANINCEQTYACVSAERVVNLALGGNCHVPVAIYCAPLSKNDFTLCIRVLNPHGDHCIETSVTGNHPQSLAERCIKILMDKGVKTLLDQF